MKTSSFQTSSGSTCPVDGLPDLWFSCAMRSPSKLLASTACAALLAGCATMFLPRPEVAGPPVDYPAQFVTSITGLRIASYEVPGTQRVSMTVSYGVGAADDPAGKEGLAHLVEHLTFRSRNASKPGAHEIAGRLKAMGAEYNAITSKDSTDYFAQVPPSAFTQLAALEGERMRDPLAGITGEVFKVERDVVLAEMRERSEELPEADQAESLQELAFQGHPYGRHATGASVAALTLEDARDFAARHYVAANAIVVVTGAIDAGEARSDVSSWLDGPLAGRTKEQIPPRNHRAPDFALDQVKAARAVKHGAVDMPQVWMAWTVPGGAEPHQKEEARMLAELLAGGLRKVFAGDERIYRVIVFSRLDQSAGTIVAAVETGDEKDVPDVEEKMKNAAYEARTLAKKPTFDALRARLVETYGELEELSGIAIARWVRHDGDAKYISGTLQLLTQLKDKPLDKYAFDYLPRERAATLVVLPDPQSLRLGQASEAKPRADAFDDTDEALRSGDVRPIAEGPGLGGATRWTLANGLPVVVVEKDAVPVADVRLVIRTPALPKKGPELAVGYLATGASWYWYQPHYFKLIGASTHEELDDDHLTYGARGMAANLVHLLADVSDWAVQHPCDEAALEGFRKGAVHSTPRENRRPLNRFRQAFDGSLFPDHPYGVYTSAADYEGVDNGSARDWMDRTVRPSNATLVIVGEVKATPELKEQLESLFGRWTSGESKPAGKLAVPAQPAPTTVRLLDRPGATQASIRAGYRLDGLDAPQRAAAEALGWWISRRLDSELRQRTGQSYGADVSLKIQRAAGAFVVSGAVKREAAGDALKLLEAELAKAASGALTDADAGRARWQVARSYDLRFADTSKIAERLTESAVLGLPPDFWDRLPAAYASLDPAKLSQVARRLDPAHAAIAIAGDAAALEPLLKAAGYKVERISPEPE